ADAATARLVGVEPGHVLYRPGTCAACNHTGFSGRIGVYEIVRVDDRLRRMITEGGDEDAMAAVAFAGADAPAGPATLGQGVRAYVAAGVTTVEEAIRITRQEAVD